MIFDNIRNKNIYSDKDEKLALAFDFIKRACDESLADGKYDIIKDGEMYAMVQSYKTKPISDGRYEGHRRYIDVQYVICGCESIFVSEISKFKTDAPYDHCRDIEFFSDVDGGCELVLSDGDFAVFYPNDIHKPGMTYKSESDIKKIVVKIEL